MFFMGTYTPKLDDKGRLILPAKFRDRLSEGLVVTQGQEKCLDVFPSDVFMEEADRARAKGMTSRSGRDQIRMLFSSAEEVVPDKQGRIPIAVPLREYAAISRDVIVIGAMDRVEIWEPHPLARLQRRGPGELRRPRRGRTAHRTDQQHPGTSSTTPQRFAGRGLGPLQPPSVIPGAPSPVPGDFPPRVSAFWDTFPGPRRQRSGLRPGPANPTTPQQLPRSSTSSKGRSMHLPTKPLPWALRASESRFRRDPGKATPQSPRRTGTAPGARAGPRGRRADGVLGAHLGGARHRARGPRHLGQQG